MAGRAAVGVDDDLAAGEAGVGVRAAELELAGRVGQDLVAVVGELRRARSGAMTWSRRSGLSSVSRSMPGPCWVEMSTVVEPDRAAVLVVDGDLGLAVGAQVRAARPALRTWARRWASRWASQIGSGMRSAVSSQA